MRDDYLYELRHYGELRNHDTDTAINTTENQPVLGQ